MRLTADASPDRWTPVTGSLGWRGRRQRKAAIGMLLGRSLPGGQAAARPGSGVAAWAMSQFAPLLMRRADGRVLAWTWKSDPELVVAMATAQELTAQLRTARAMMPMEHDDTEDFRNPYLGRGEKLVMALPPQPEVAPFATYTWDTGTHLVTLQAVSRDRERFGTVLPDVEEIARTLRPAEDLTAGASPTVLRIDPA